MVVGPKSLIESLIKQNECRARFCRRKSKYSFLRKYLPSRFNEIITNSPPWYHHGLGFRLATFLDGCESEHVFKRLNSLLEMAESLDGWKNESKNTGESWAKDYSEFFHHLWMLQCVEYFINNGFSVSFIGKQGRRAPDLKIIKHNNTQYVECYVYSKWWFTEEFIKEIVKLMDPNIHLERMYNIKPLTTKKDIDSLLTEISSVLEHSKLESARKKASIKYPVTLYENHGVRLLMDGKGEYQASDNAHGDPECSAQTYVNDCINHKCEKNDLASHRPNILMVNGLGMDWQNIFLRDNPRLHFDCANIDDLKIHACGIDEKLVDCTRYISVLK